MSEPSKTYAVPKYWVWLFSCVIFLWGGYKVYDYFAHVNWPPADPRNLAFFQALAKDLNCEKFGSYSITQEMIDGDSSGKSYRPVGFDRRIFFDAPGCIGAGIYVLKEGTGLRDQFDIFDMTTKQRTARVTITHESFKLP